MPRFAAIVNPISGYRDRLLRVKRIQRLLGLRGAELTIWVTDAPRHAEELAREVPMEVAALLVAGGDGTIGEVIHGLGTRCIPLAFLRTGTENLLARELHMPSGVDGMVDLLMRGVPCPIDVGLAGERRFLAVAGVGFDAECVRRMNRIRRGHITRMDYFVPIWSTFWNYSFPRFQVECDGQPVFDGRGFFLIGNIARYSAEMRILRVARYDDGLLDLTIFPCATRSALASHGLRALLRMDVTKAGVIYRQCRSIRADSDAEVPIELDGELGGVLPRTFSVLPGAARFLRKESSR